MTDHRPTLPDINVLLALTNPSHQHHDHAHAWLRSTERYATTPITESGLLRLLMNPAVTGQHVAPAQALAVLAGVRADDRAAFLVDDTSLAAAAVDLVGLAGYRQVTDLHLVALAGRHDHHLVTFDRRIVGSLAAADQHLVRTL